MINVSLHAGHTLFVALRVERRSSAINSRRLFCNVEPHLELLITRKIIIAAALRTYIRTYICVMDCVMSLFSCVCVRVVAQWVLGGTRTHQIGRLLIAYGEMDRRSALTTLGFIYI